MTANWFNSIPDIEYLRPGREAAAIIAESSALWCDSRSASYIDEPLQRFPVVRTRSAKLLEPTNPILTSGLYIP